MDGDDAKKLKALEANGRLRDECLSMEWFRNRVEAATVIQ